MTFDRYAVEGEAFIQTSLQKLSIRQKHINKTEQNTHIIHPVCLFSHAPIPHFWYHAPIVS